MALLLRSGEYPVAEIVPHSQPHLSFGHQPHKNTRNLKSLAARVSATIDAVHSRREKRDDRSLRWRNGHDAAMLGLPDAGDWWSGRPAARELRGVARDPL